ncbi:hypothetical protein TURU_105291 [Turdus rufiventris]|nr:hypothetical protein TURU_105291 [Turdus rufiventris]
MGKCREAAKKRRGKASKSGEKVLLESAEKWRKSAEKQRKSTTGKHRESVKKRGEAAKKRCGKAPKSGEKAPRIQTFSQVGSDQLVEHTDQAIFDIVKP